MKKKQFKVVQITKVVTAYFLICQGCGMTIDIPTEFVVNILDGKLGGYSGIICPKCKYEHSITKKEIKRDIPYPVI